MIWVMIAGVAGYLVIARPSADCTIEEPAVRQYLVVANHTLGGPQLLDVIRDRMARGPAEFWILSTLPPGISRWLAWDLPHRVRRRTDIPLTVITAAD
jgi:hypothetical protein